jgi:SPP1 family predicted phage head-tail adaptor
MKTVSPLGRLRKRVTLEQPVEAPDAIGGVTRGFAALATLWAEIAPAGTAESFIAAQKQERITHRVRLRWFSAVTAAMRLRLGTRMLLIRDVTDEDETRRYLICHCEEVKP